MVILMVLMMVVVMMVMEVLEVMPGLYVVMLSTVTVMATRIQRTRTLAG